METTINDLLNLQNKPAPFSPGEPLFWADPHISQQMLATHLNPEIDAASRNPETIQKSVEWMIETLHLTADDSVFDLGCGPGLYAVKMAECGLCVTGIDISPRSIAYAKEYAEAHHLSIDYRCQDYLDLTDSDCYDAVFLIFGDFCTFSPSDRRRLLGNIHRALRPAGHFILDVSTRQHRTRAGIKNGWYLSPGGFWRPGPHLVLEQGFDYPGEAIWLDQYIVIEEGNKVAVYRNWFQDYTAETISEELSAGGFTVQSLWADLTGTPLDENSEWIGAVAQRE